MTPQLTWATIRMFLLWVAPATSHISPMWNTVVPYGFRLEGVDVGKKHGSDEGSLAGEGAIYFFPQFPTDSPVAGHLGYCFQVYVPFCLSGMSMFSKV
ncbi:hypothetical protein CDAR_120511 [Caerostris darwini]|uniref:Uncharacterized protein n=1 Tax=Caerostris darwini TaxID=1538125 RepID=A0AAV4WB19_9ARAC|nr:hypothetical protein CDAR_120511 [Caerostris darwini]